MITKDGSNAKIVVGSYSGSTVSFGTPATLGGVHNGSLSWEVAGFSDTSALAFYTTSGGSLVGHAVDINSGNNTISSTNSAVTLYGATSDYLEASVSGTVAGMFYMTLYDGSANKLVIGKRNGTTIDSVATATVPYYFAVGAEEMGSTSNVVIGIQDSSSNSGVLLADCSSGITLGQARLATTNSQGFSVLRKLTNSQYVLCMEDSFFSSMVGEYTGTEFGTIIGTANGAASTGQTVSVLLNGVSENHSSLSPGTNYYSLPDGSLTTTTTSAPVGLALSPTALLLDIQR
jgi:hypothetical protein